MKKGKKIIVVILSILIVLTSIVAYASSLLRLGALNPGVYKNFMPAIRSYNSLYDSVYESYTKPLETVDIPEELVGVPEDIFESTLHRGEFNKMVGEAIGGGIGWLLYNHDDVEIPVMAISQKLKTAIAEDERIINSDTNIKAVLDAVVTQNIEKYAPKGDFEQTYRGYLYYYLTGGVEQFQNTYDYWVDVFFYYYGIRLSWITIGSFLLLIGLFVLVFFISKEKRETPFKLAKVLCIVYAALNVLAAVVLFAIPYIANIISGLSEYAKYIGYFKSTFISFGMLAIVYALLLVAVSLLLNYASKRIENGRQEA